MHDIVIDEFISFFGDSIKNTSYAISNTHNAKWIYFYIVRILSNNISDIEKSSPDTLEEKTILLKSLDNILSMDIPYLKDTIIKTGNAEYIYKYKKNIILLLNKLEMIILKKFPNIEEKVISCIYNLIKTLKDENLDDEIINTKKLKYMYKYSKDIKESDTSKFQNEFIKARNPKYLYLLAHNVKGMDQIKIMDKIIDIGNAKYIYMFAKEIKDSNIRLLEEAIINTGSPKYIYLFSRDIKGANIVKLSNAILETKNTFYICEFVKNIECDLEKFEFDALFSSDAEYIYELAKVKDVNIRKMTQAIKRTASPKYIYLFALNIKGVNIRTLENSLVRALNPEYMYLFALNIPGADIFYIGRMLFKTKDIYWINKFFNDINGANISYGVTEIAKYNLDPENVYIPSLVSKHIKDNVDVIEIPIEDRDNIIKLGRRNGDVYHIINECKKANTNEVYISNLVRKYYLEEEQYFLDDKPKQMLPIKNNH